MHCTCTECNGEGVVEIECSECLGAGAIDEPIEQSNLFPSINNYQEVFELQRDAKRVISQADQLKKLRPDRAESYDAQLKAMLFIIDAQATEAAKKKD